MMEPNDRDLAAARSAHEGLVEALRELIHASVALKAPTALLDEWRARIEALRPAFAEHAEGRWLPKEPGDGLLPYSPVCGRSNPLAPPLEVEVDGVGRARRAVGHVRFGDACEAWGGNVHGALIAATFDQILALAAMVNRIPAPTAELTVHYRRLTPINTDLRFEAWVESVEGRKVRVRGTCSLADSLLSEADGLFVHQRDLAPEFS